MKRKPLDFGVSLRKRRVWYADDPPPTPPEDTDPPDHDTSPSGAQKPEHMIPQSRLNEEIGKKKALETNLTAVRTELETFKTAQATAEEDRLKKQGEFESLFEAEKVKTTDLTTQLNTATAGLKAYQDVFNTTLEKRKEALPDHIKPLLENMDALKQMEYLDANAEQFAEPDTGQPRKQTAPPMHGSDGVGNKPGEKTGTLRQRARL